MAHFFTVERKIAGVSTIRQWMLISSAFSILLLLLRIIMSAQFSYAFLAWNLFLAYLPFSISNWLSNHPEVGKKKLKLILLVSLWLLFMPNSFYILTDLFHLQNEKNGHPWFDLTLILSFAWNGILYGIISIWQMERLIARVSSKYASDLVVCVVMWLNAFGIYIGRFLRFNSWDIIFNPFSLLRQIAEMVFNPYDHKSGWAMSVCFASFIIILYYTIKKLAELFRHG